MRNPPQAFSPTNTSRITITAKSLRDRFSEEQDWARQFEQAVELWDSLFNTLRSRYPVSSRFEPHINAAYCSEVEERLISIIYGPAQNANTLPSGSFVPSQREALLLTVAAWLHPLGIMWGIFPEEQNAPTRPGEEWTPLPKSEVDLQTLAQNYGKRTGRYLATVWLKFNHEWRPTNPVGDSGPLTEDVALLAALCEAQQSHIRIEELGKVLKNYEGLSNGNLQGFAEKFGRIPDSMDESDASEPAPDTVRFWKLVILLRLANVTRIHHGICPLDLATQLRPTNLQGNCDSYEGICDFVEHVAFDHGDNSVVVHAIAPNSVDLSTSSAPDAILAPLTLDVRPALEYLRCKLEGIVSVVEKYLWKCENTKFSGVRLELASLGRETDVDILYRFIDRVWALQMAATTCATEGACYFALMLHRHLQQELETSTEDSTRINRPHLKVRVLNKCKMAKSVQRFNVLTFRLATQIEDLIKDWPEKENVAQGRIEELTKILEKFLSDRLTECRACGQFGKDLGTAGVLIVYGFSSNVFQAIKDSGFKGQIWFVPVSRLMRRPEAEFMDDRRLQSPEAGEDARVRSWCDQHHLQTECVATQILPSRVSAAVNNGQRVVYLVGTRTVLSRKRNSCLSSVGNLANAALVKMSRGEVVVIAERGKIASKTEMESLLEQYSNLNPRQPDFERIEKLNLNTHLTRICVPK